MTLGYFLGFEKQLAVILKSDLRVTLSDQHLRVVAMP
jgi:hypothetical protein